MEIPNMTTDEMKLESVRILTRFHDMEVESGEGMFILAMTLATTFRQHGVSQHEAINRFTTIVRNVYKEQSK
jgi:hypothetical protein